MTKKDTSTKDSRMVTGLFRDRDSAESAYRSVTGRGYTKDDVNLVMSEATRKRHFGDADTELGSKAAEGAGVGAGIGGAIGAALAAAAAVGTSLALPGLGVVVAGPIAAALAGAGAGGLTGGLVGALIGSGIPEERVKDYAAGVKKGGILMGVAPRSDADAAFIESDWKGKKGEHVVGTGVGAAGGALAGAAMGTPGGPAGMAVGAALGGIAGGLAGKGVAEVVNPKPDDDLGSHHLARGIGAGSGAAAGAAIGAVGGPAGMAVGAGAGALAGGALGHGVGKVVNPEEESAFWRSNYQSAPYYSAGYTYDDYGPAYELGYTGRSRYAGNYDSVESDLSDDWERMKRKSRLTWDQAKSAVRAAWDKIERAMPGDADGDGR